MKDFTAAFILRWRRRNWSRFQAIFASLQLDSLLVETKMDNQMVQHMILVSGHVLLLYNDGNAAGEQHSSQRLLKTRVARHYRFVKALRPLWLGMVGIKVLDIIARRLSFAESCFVCPQLLRRRRIGEVCDEGRERDRPESVVLSSPFSEGCHA